MTDKLMGAVSLCRKAGKLVMGSDVCAEAVRARKAALVLLTNDLAERSAKRIRLVCEECGVKLLILPRGMEELAPVAGKSYGVFAVCDRGFAKMIGDAAQKAESCLDIEPEH